MLCPAARVPAVGGSALGTAAWKARVDLPSLLLRSVTQVCGCGEGGEGCSRPPN